jgi:hypothetical protein
MNAIKGRKEVSVETTTGSLVVRNKSYIAELATTEAASVPQMQEQSKEGSSSITLDQNLWEWISTAVDRLRLERRI